MENNKKSSAVSDTPGDAAHVLASADVAARLGVQPDAGLSAAQVAQRKQQQGPNRLPEAQQRSAWLVFVSQFKSILILILIGAALLAAMIGNTKDALVILAVVLINASVGFYQEHRAEQSLAALRKMLPVKTRVRRDGDTREVLAEDLVPGDIVLLEAGDQVPADGRLALAAGLEVDESALTGESHPVGKQDEVASDADAPLAERANMLFMNTMLTRGRAELIVTATGAATEMGRLSQELASTTEAPTPLQIQLDQLGRRLGAIALSLVGLLSFLAYLRGTGLAEIALDAIALAVAAMPEGLPVVVTVTLALGMRNMARQRAIVKRLASVETLGCTTVICSDKTGTLTLNQMMARSFLYRGAVFDVSGEGYRAAGEIHAAHENGATPDLEALLVPLVACNDSRVDDGKAIGDPMEAALLVLAKKGGVDRQSVEERLPRTAEIPFDATHKFMATFHRVGDRVRMFVKGAPDVLLACCTQLLDVGGELPLDASARQKIEEHYAAFAARGLRGLLVASRELPAAEFDLAGDLHQWATGLTFVGLVGLMDPPRAEARQAVAQCRQAGITVKIITGDHHLTAAAIARELGVEGRAVTGVELDRMDSDQLAEAIDEVTVFSRVTPAHKVKIVRALQKKGHVVAMTGDGVNDAPALKGADIGVAMGTAGTAVAKEAAAMVLTDDNFATLVAAVRQGRTLYDNILKFVRFQLSTTIGAILTVFLAPLAGLPEPFSPVQILWVAIIMDGPPAISLALDAARPGIMTEAPRSRTAPVLPFARIGKVIAYGVTMMAGTLGVLHYGLYAGMEQRALTLAFTTFVLFQFFNVFNARAERGTAFNRNFFANSMLWLSLAGVLLLQGLAVHWPPAQSVFGTQELSMAEWTIAAGVAATILLLEEARKLLAEMLGRLRMDAESMERPHALIRQVFMTLLRLLTWAGRIEKTVLLAAFFSAASLFAFFSIADEMLEGETHAFDSYVLMLFRDRADPSNPLGPPWLEVVMRDFTALGGFAVLTMVTLMAVGYLALTRKRHAAWMVVWSVMGGVVLSNLLKWGFARPRPDLVPHATVVYTLSFPSGHAMLSAIVYLTLGALLARTQADVRVKAYLLAAAAAVTLIVGISRIYLGVHWPTDVLAGWTVGAGWALLCWVLMLWLQGKGKVEPPVTE